MTLRETADSINRWFRQYGLDHDVVEYRLGLRPIMKHGEVIGTAHGELALVNGHDEAAMELFHTTLEHVFEEYFVLHPPEEQMRLF